jgi:transcriptional regulator with XRE-family HTH domain
MRKRAGLTVRELAVRVGLGVSSGAYLSQLEAGTKTPSPAIAGALAEVLRDDPEVYRLWAALGRRSDPLQVTRAVARLSEIIGDPRLAESLRGEGDHVLRTEVAADRSFIAPPPARHPREDRRSDFMAAFRMAGGPSSFPVLARKLTHSLREAAGEWLPMLPTLTPARPDALAGAIRLPLVEEGALDAGPAIAHARHEVALPATALADPALAWTPASFLVRVGRGSPRRHEFPPGAVLFVSYPQPWPVGRLLALQVGTGRRLEWAELFSNGSEAVHLTDGPGGFEVLRPGDARLRGMVRARVMASPADLLARP